MADLHFHAKLFVDMLCQMLSGIHTAMLTARTTETEHQRGETTLDITVHVMIGKCIDMLQELENLTIILQESDDRFVQTRQLLVRFITAWVMRASTVKDIEPETCFAAPKIETFKFFPPLNCLLLYYYCKIWYSCKIRMINSNSIFSMI